METLKTIQIETGFKDAVSCMVGSISTPESVTVKDKSKVVPVLLLTEHHVMKKYWYSLTSALDGGERLASRPGRFTPREREPGTHWIGGTVGPRAGLDIAVAMRKKVVLCQCRE